MPQSQDKTFQRRKEDFLCGQCGAQVDGDGYTNHCPRCLYSQHVDIHPGDRAAVCGGLMEPVFLEKESGEEKLTHRCVLCGYEKKNKTAENDDFEALLTLSRHIANR
ncbi:MAG: RNHCP domain-containing protein [Candidatus Moraniibacteriota bacterium]